MKEHDGSRKVFHPVDLQDLDRREDLGHLNHPGDLEGLYGLEGPEILEVLNYLK